MASKKQLSARTQQVMQAYLGLPPGMRERAVSTLASQLDRAGMDPASNPNLGADPELAANATLPMNALPMM